MLRKRAEEELYRAYVTDVLKATAEMIAAIGGGRVSMRRWHDLAHGKPQKEEARSAEEIISSISEGLDRLGKE